MTTPLPPLPKTGLGLCFFDEGGAHPCDGNGYTAKQMQAYAAQARAELEAENKRLRESLIELLDHYEEYGSDPYYWKETNKVKENARAALKETP